MSNENLLVDIEKVVRAVEEDDTQIETASNAESRRCQLVRDLVQISSDPKVWPLLVWANSIKPLSLERAIADSKSHADLPRTKLTIGRLGENGSLALKRVPWTLGSPRGEIVHVVVSGEKQKEQEYYEEWVAKDPDLFGVFMDGMAQIWVNLVSKLPEIKKQLNQTTLEAEKIAAVETSIKDLASVLA